jgi:hypothetical protein
VIPTQYQNPSILSDKMRVKDSSEKGNGFHAVSARQNLNRRSKMVETVIKSPAASLIGRFDRGH